MTETRALGLEPIEGAKPQTDDLRCWSVTTIIGCLEKPALLYWAAEEAAKAAVSAAKSLPIRIEEDGEAEVVKWLRDARFRRPKDRLSSTALGTVAHAACESYALTGNRPDDEQLAFMVNGQADKGFTGTKSEVAVLSQMLNQFEDWLARFTPSYQATEVAVYTPTYAVAGTADGFFTIDGTRFIFDIKTSRETVDSQGKPRTPYPEAALQMAAYRYAEMAAVWRPRRTEIWRRRYYLLSQEELAMAVPVPEVDAGCVLHLTPGSCEAYTVRCDEEVYRSFLFVLEAARWQMGLSKEAIGPPLLPPTRWEMKPA